jgi:RecJ-like exonuclease
MEYKMKKIRNYYTDNPVVLRDGEILCRKCKGRGFVEEKISTLTMSVMCKFCLGNGKVLWTEDMMGGKDIDDFSRFTSEQLQEAEEHEKEISERIKEIINSETFKKVKEAILKGLNK